MSEDRVVVLTGSSKGLGAALIIKHLVEKGCDTLRSAASIQEPDILNTNSKSLITLIFSMFRMSNFWRNCPLVRFRVSTREADTKGTITKKMTRIARIGGVVVHPDPAYRYNSYAMTDATKYLSNVTITLNGANPPPLQNRVG